MEAAREAMVEAVEQCSKGSTRSDVVNINTTINRRHIDATLELRQVVVETDAKTLEGAQHDRRQRHGIVIGATP